MHGGFTSSGKCRRIYETQTGSRHPHQKQQCILSRRSSQLKTRDSGPFFSAKIWGETWHDEWPTSHVPRLFGIVCCIFCWTLCSRSRLHDTKPRLFWCLVACLIVKFFVGKINSCLSCVSESCLVIPPAQLVKPPMTTHSSRIHIFLQYMIYVFFFKCFPKVCVF